MGPLAKSVAATMLVAMSGPVTALAAAERPSSTQEGELRSRFRAMPDVTSLKLKSTRDGGTQAVGELDGRSFSLRFPPNWNRKAAIFAHGYVIPNGNKPDKVSADPVADDPSLGLLPEAYRRGYAVGHTSYDKLGLAVSSGVRRNVALGRLLRAVGATNVYLTGASMGGSITAITSQRHPQAFDGAMAVCGPVSDWTHQIDYVTHVRALYNYFSAGTAYELPGSKDVTSNPTGGGLVKLLLRLRKLQNDATANPNGEAAAIIAKTMSAVPGQETKPDFSSVTLAVLLASNGMDDFKAVLGGFPADNSDTVYRSSLLDEKGNATLNRDIQRYRADPAARMRMANDFSTSGDQRMNLLTVHNAYDSLVAYEQGERLRRKVEQAGHLANLAQRTVPTMTLGFSSPALKKVLPVSGLFHGSFGAMHCGFTPEQMYSGFSDLVDWTESGRKPAESFRKDLDH